MLAYVSDSAHQRGTLMVDDLNRSRRAAVKELVKLVDEITKARPSCFIWASFFSACFSECEKKAIGRSIVSSIL